MSYVIFYVTLGITPKFLRPVLRRFLWLLQSEYLTGYYDVTVTCSSCRVYPRPQITLKVAPRLVSYQGNFRCVCPVVKFALFYVRHFNSNVRFFSFSAAQLIPVRLADGSNANEGRVKVCFNNTWGTVCHNSWCAADARVVCRQLGMPHEMAQPLRGAAFGQGVE